MTNPSRAKGTWAESKVVTWARANGYPHADRQPLRGNRDAGDVALCPGVIVEVKSHNGAPAVGQPPPSTLAAWMAQTEAERVNAHADVGVLVVKRRGTTNPGGWWAYVPVWTLAELIDPSVRVVFPNLNAPAFLMLDDVATMLRAAGYGAPLTPEETP